MSSQTNPFPGVRRVVTGHSSDGKSIVLKDEVQKPTYLRPGAVNPVYDLHRAPTIPEKNDSELVDGEWVDEIARNPAHSSKDGAVFRTYDLGPKSSTPYHRTITLDYGIVTKGTITLELDDGKLVTLKEGDTIVQRGTIHSWRNDTDEWARVYFIILGAHPTEVNGEALKEEWRVKQ